MTARSADVAKGKPVLVGIAGGTGAGKTTLVRALTARLEDSCVVDLDSYYLDRSGIAPAERAGLNYDLPFAFDVGLLLDHLQRLASGEPVGKPRYSFETHTRIGVEPLLPSRIIFVEGHFTLWWGEVRTMFGLKVFVDAPADLRLLRRFRRDLIERGRTIDSVVAQYLTTVRPMHERYIEPTRAYADLVVLNDGALDACTEQVLAAVHASVGRRAEAPTSR